MADLVAVSSFLQFLGSPDEADAGLLDSLLTQTQRLLEMQAGRETRPFQLEQPARVERHDGTGSPTLILDYPIGALTSVLLGFDAALPDETLAVADQAALVWTAGSARLRRVDGRCFGSAGLPGYVHVTYDAQEDLPESASLAVMRVAAAIYQQRGNEDLRTRREGGFQGEIAPAAASDPVWQSVVKAYRVPCL